MQKMETKTTEEITFSLRIPCELNAKICRDAEKKRRSRQAHIVYLLEQLFAATPNGNGKKKEAK